MARDVAPGDVDETERPENEYRRDHKERAGHDSARDAVEQPADVNRELLRLGPRQEHAKIQRVQKARLANPAAFLDQFGLHDRDLSRRPAEADESELEPKAERLRECGVPCGGAVIAAVRRSRRQACRLSAHRAVRFDAPAEYSARTVSAMPPRAENSAVTTALRGAHAATKSSRMRFVTASLNARSFRNEAR